MADRVQLGVASMVLHMLFRDAACLHFKTVKTPINGIFNKEQNGKTLCYRCTYYSPFLLH